MRTRGAWQHRGREGTAPDGTHWLLAAARHAGTPSVVRLRHQPQELRNDTRALRWPWFSESPRLSTVSAIQKLQSRTSFISDTSLSAAAAFTLASWSLLAEDPPPSVLLRVASGALIGPSHRVFCGAAQLMAARRRGTVRVWRQEATRYCHKEDARGGVCTEEAAIFRCRIVAF